MATLPPPSNHQVILKDSEKKTWYKRWWVWGVSVLAVIAIANSLGSTDNTSTDGKIEKTEVATDETSTSESVPVQSSTITNAGFGSGTKIVGTDIKPGRYLTTTASESCYWVRLSGFGGSIGEILANETSGGSHQVIEISSSDRGFSSSDCGTWFPYVANRAARVTDGTWVVNDEIEPGLWKATNPSECYWARLSGFSGTFNELISNELNIGIVQIDLTDVGFKSSGCGTWTKIG